jgi:mRNA-degrading endonuclease RelE of RelBE toxin-antitoxin system
MAWAVRMEKTVIDDLRWFGRKEGRILLQAVTERLSADPLTESRNLKCLRPNAFAERELRIFQKYRVLFNVDIPAQLVTIVLIGEKRGAQLFVQGKEFTLHHEQDNHAD